jgi:hypothetical protein
MQGRLSSITDADKQVDAGSSKLRPNCNCPKMPTVAHLRPAVSTASARSPGNMLHSCRWGTGGGEIAEELEMLQNGNFPSSIDRNFTFLLLMHGVAVGWVSTLYGMSTLALACLLV